MQRGVDADGLGVVRTPGPPPVVGVRPRAPEMTAIASVGPPWAECGGQAGRGRGTSARRLSSLSARSFRTLGCRRGCGVI